MEHFYNSINTRMFNFPKLYSRAVSDCPDNGVMIEVGSWVGESLAYLAVEAINSGKNITIYSVDAFIGNKHHGTNGSDYSQWSTYKANLAPVWSHIVPIKGISWEVANNFEDDSIDFIFIDADHKYECVMKDIKAYWPKLKSGGTLSGHDIKHSPVAKAVDDWTEDMGLGKYSIGENSWWLVKP